MPTKYLLLTGMALIIAACQARPIDQARQRVQVGMSRNDAVKILSQQAWYYQPCENQVGFADLFFYGDHHYDKAEIVIVTSLPDAQEYRVVKIGTFDEPNAWHAAYSDCIQRDRFEK